MPVEGRQACRARLTGTGRNATRTTPSAWRGGVPVEVRESAPSTTPPSYRTAIMVVCEALAVCHHRATGSVATPRTPVDTPLVVPDASAASTYSMLAKMCETGTHSTKPSFKLCRSFSVSPGFAAADHLATGKDCPYSPQRQWFSMVWNRWAPVQPCRQMAPPKSPLPCDAMVCLPRSLPAGSVIGLWHAGTQHQAADVWSGVALLSTHASYWRAPHSSWSQVCRFVR